MTITETLRLHLGAETNACSFTARASGSAHRDPVDGSGYLAGAAPGAAPQGGGGGGGGGQEVPLPGAAPPEPVGGGGGGGQRPAGGAPFSAEPGGGGGGGGMSGRAAELPELEEGAAALEGGGGGGGGHRWAGCPVAPAVVELVVPDWVCAPTERQAAVSAGKSIHDRRIVFPLEPLISMV